MKTITLSLTALFLMFGQNLVSQTVIFEEKFSNITATYVNNPANNQGTLVIPANEFDFYTDNLGWSGENVCIGAPLNGMAANMVPKFRVNIWTHDNASLTTPTIDSSGDEGKVTLIFKLKRVLRGSGVEDYDKARILHAPDGINFVKLEDVEMDASADPAWTEHSISVTNGTANSKFKFSAVPGVERTTTGAPNRFFVDSVVVRSGITTTFSNIEIENNVRVFPKLATSQITISSAQEISNIQIISIMGQIVVNQKETIVNVSNLSSGIYNVLITLSNGRQVVEKIIKE